MRAEDPPQEGRSRFYRYNGRIKGREDLPDPDVVFMTVEPMSAKAVKRVLLTELT